MKVKVLVTQKELDLMAFSYKELQECVYSDLVSSDIDNEYPDIEVIVEVENEN